MFNSSFNVSSYSVGNFWTIRYIKRVNSCIIGIIIDIPIVFIIIFSLIGGKRGRTRGRGRIIYGINYPISCDHADCTASMIFNMYEQHPPQHFGLITVNP
jgi:hypothetical protein